MVSGAKPRVAVTFDSRLDTEDASNLCCLTATRMNSTIKWPSWFVLNRYWLGLAGARLVTTAVISWRFVLPPQTPGERPYHGMVIPIGIRAGKRRIRRGLKDPACDRQAQLHQFAWFFGVRTLFNVILGTKFTYRGRKHGETPRFLGEFCQSRNSGFACNVNSQCSGRPRADSWEAAKRKLLEDAATPLPSPVSI